MTAMKGTERAHRPVFAGGLALLGVLLLLALLAGEAAAAAKTFPPFVPTDPILPVAKLRPGMRGECLTVVRGTKIVRFPAEIVEIIPRQGSPRNLIMIRVGGPVIRETGGIASGMSGSPFYIGGKLVGAIGYGWNFSRHDLGLVTPIEDLIEVWNYPEDIPSFELPPLIPEGPPGTEREEEHPLFRPKSADVTSGDAVSGDAVASLPPELSGALFVNGVSQRMAGEIGKALGREVVPLGGSAGNREQRVKYDAAVKPGMAVGVALVWGDVEVGAIGTLSAVAKDGRIVAFAHPFMGLGTTTAALMEADIAKVVPSLQSPFKLGTTGDIIGIVTQDRPQGIGGRIGVFAPAASCTVDFKDVDAGRSAQRRFQMVHDKFQIANLAGMAIAGCVEDLWGRRGGGSAKVTATFAGSAMPDGWKRTNVFVSERDVIQEMLKEFNLLTQVFAVNQFQELRPFGIRVDVEMTQEPRVLYVEDVVIANESLRPGERVSFDITLRPWRKAPFTRTYSLVVPKNVTGICELLVRGGGIAEENAEYMEAGWRSISSLPILLKEIDAKETNDQIVLEIRGQEALEEQIKRARGGNIEDLINDKLKSEIREEKMKEGSMRIIRTNYYVDGLIHRLIKVEGEQLEEEDAPADEAPSGPADDATRREDPEEDGADGAEDDGGDDSEDAPDDPVERVELLREPD